MKEVERMKLQVTKYMSIELTEPNELVELMSEDDKVEFMQSLSCHDSVINYVAQQIINGCTDDGFHGGVTSVSANPSTPLQNAQREVAKNSGDIARKEIESLEKALNNAVKSSDEWQDKYYELKNKIEGCY